MENTTFIIEAKITLELEFYPDEDHSEERAVAIARRRLQSVLDHREIEIIKVDKE